MLVAVCYASAAATGSLYPTVADRVSAATAINASPSVVALYGPILDVRSLGELAMTKMTVLYAVFVALLLLVVVRRHTRSEEESGQAELLGGTAIGRDAPLAAAVSFGAIISVAVGLLAALAEHGGRAAGRRIAAVRRLVGRDRAGRHRSHRRRVPALGERPHLRGHRRRRDRRCCSCCAPWATPRCRG